MSDGVQDLDSEDEDDSAMDLSWTSTDRACPDCGATVQTRAWWDDPPSMGGACIGSQYCCVNETCDWWEDE